MSDFTFGLMLGAGLALGILMLLVDIREFTVRTVRKELENHVS